MNITILFLCLALVPSHLFGKAGPEVPLTNPPATISQDKLNQQLTDGILAVSVDDVKKAVSAGADINYVDHDGKTPVWLALLLNRFDIIFELLQHGAKIDAVYRSRTFVQAMLDEADNRNAPTIKCLALLVTNGVDFSVLKIKGMHIEAFTIGALNRGIQQASHAPHAENSLLVNSLDLAKQLIAHGYKKIIDYMWGPSATSYLSPAVIDLCMKNGIDINQPIVVGRHGSQDEYLPPLFNAIKDKRGGIRAVQNLLNAGANPNITFNAYGDYKPNALQTPLIFDIQINGGGSIEALLKAGADINLVANPEGNETQTALDYAIANKKSEAIRILMQRGAKTYRQLQAK